MAIGDIQCRGSMTAPARRSDQGSQTTRCTRARQACHRRALLRRPARVTGARHHLCAYARPYSGGLGSEVQRTWNHRRVRCLAMEDSDLVAARVGLVVAIAAVLVVVGGGWIRIRRAPFPRHGPHGSRLFDLGSDRVTATGWCTTSAQGRLVLRRRDHERWQSTFAKQGHESP